MDSKLREWFNSAAFSIVERHASPWECMERTPFVNYACNEELGIDYTTYKDVYKAYQEYLDDLWELD